MTDKKMMVAGVFARVINDEGLTEHGITNGDLVYVAGDGFAPAEGDGYDYRLIFIVSKLDDGHIKPDENKAVAVDGTSLEHVDDETGKRLDRIKTEDYGSDEEGTVH